MLAALSRHLGQHRTRSTGVLKVLMNAWCLGARIRGKQGSEVCGIPGSFPGSSFGFPAKSKDQLEPWPKLNSPLSEPHPHENTLPQLTHTHTHACACVLIFFAVHTSPFTVPPILILRLP